MRMRRVLQLTSRYRNLSIDLVVYPNLSHLPATLSFAPSAAHLARGFASNTEIELVKHKTAWSSDLANSRSSFCIARDDKALSTRNVQTKRAHRVSFYLKSSYRERPDYRNPTFCISASASRLSPPARFASANISASLN